MMGEKNTSAEKATAESKIDRETAENELVRFCEANRIEHEESAMNNEEKKSFADIKKQFVKNCMEGRVEVDGTSIKYTISNFSPENFRGEVITIKRPSGNAFSAMDSYKEQEGVHKLHGFISAITGKETKYFSKLDIVDWKFFNSIASLFLSL